MKTYEVQTFQKSNLKETYIFLKEALKRSDELKKSLTISAIRILEYEDNEAISVIDEYFPEF